MTVCFTGHRPNKLSGYDPKDNRELLWDLHHLVGKFIERGFDTFINGVALGVDQWAAMIVIKYKEKYPHIKLISAVPCLNQSNKWSKSLQEKWQYIIYNSDEVVYVSNEEYTSYCMNKRNIWMVDNSDEIISVHDGSKGGTENCVAYTQKIKKPITNLWKESYRK